MGYDGTVVGVIKNYHYQPLQNKINMMYFTNDPDSYNYLYIRVQPQNLPQTIQRIEGIWEELYGDGSFTYSFVDEVFDRYYRKEMRAGKLISFFCALAVFISSLGLLALSSYLSQLRLKEIGIRKVLGATVSQLGYKLTSGYLLWIAVANLLSIPLCIYFMNKWLQAFAYHTSITVPMFLTTLGLTLLVGGLTVGIQAVRAARSNPVKVLKYE
jgi:ABC-type antimicrobial peptide transport system permease subunit